jgi:hypothetical protein
MALRPNKKAASDPLFALLNEIPDATLLTLHRRSVQLSYGTTLILLANFSGRLDFAPILLRFASH